MKLLDIKLIIAELIVLAVIVAGLDYHVVVGGSLGAIMELIGLATLGLYIGWTGGLETGRKTAAPKRVRK